MRLNPALERAFQPLGFLLPLQGAPIMPKNVVKSVFGSVSARRRAPNVAIRIVLHSKDRGDLPFIDLLSL